MRFINFWKKYWLAFILLIMAYVCFIFFEVKPPTEWNARSVVMEGVYFFSCLIGYTIVRKLKIPILDMGWGLFTAGLLISFFNEFMYEPSIIRIDLNSIVTAEGLILIAVGFYTAFTKLEKIEKDMRAEHKLLQTLMDTIPGSIYFKDIKNRFIRVNKAKVEHRGTTFEDITGKTDFDFLPENEAKKSLTDDNQVMQTGKSIKDEPEKITYQNGTKHWVSVTKIPWHNEKKEVIGTIGISRDITKRKEIEEKLQNLAIRDYLTNLYNYHYFYQKLKEQANKNKKHKEVYSLIYLDIDNFKTCNDTYGHLEGDKILQILGKILQSHLRKTDSAYRYGGEEFAVLLPHTYKEQAKKIAERIRKRIQSELYPKYKITISAGVADSRTNKDVIKAADMAMYEAKREGKNKTKVA